ncbi:hypothetical protein Tco_1102615 [Tanacetum coccineum]
MAFMSSSNNNTSSTNRAINTAQAVNIAHRVSTASTQVNDAYSTNINNLSDVVIYGFEMANGHVDYEGKKVFEEYRKEAYFPPPYTGNFMPPTHDLSFIGLDEFVNKPVVENYDEEEDVSQPKTKKKTVRPSIVKKEFVKTKQQEKTDRKTVKQVEQHRQNTHSPRGNQRNWNNMMSQKLGNMSYLTDYEEIDGGYVAFEGNPKGGKITRKMYHVYSISIQLSHSRQMDGKAVVKVSLLELSWNSKAVEYPNVIKDVEENLQCQSRKETELIKDYILLPLWTADPPYSQDPKSSHDDGSKPSSDDGKKVDEDLRKENECNDQEKGDNVNNVNNVNAAAQNKVNAVVGKKALNFPFDLIMPVLLEKGVITYLTSQEIMKDDGSVAA